mmetsp:Transcript_35998/g.92719  ORF Transcript_35998/g.92719 Transcript_35998/m.92719 type:complete len:230 (-) Transcript_35998:573-1262(-)
MLVPGLLQAPHPAVVGLVVGVTHALAKWTRRVLCLPHVVAELAEALVPHLHAEVVDEVGRQRNLQVYVHHRDGEVAPLALGVHANRRGEAAHLGDGGSDVVLLDLGQVHVRPRQRWVPVHEAVALLVVGHRLLLDEEVAGGDQRKLPAVVPHLVKQVQVLDDVGGLDARHPRLYELELLADGREEVEPALDDAGQPDGHQVRSWLRPGPDVDALCRLLARPALVVEEHL